MVGRPRHKPLIVSRSEYARLRGVSAQSVTNWLDRGVIELVDGGINVERADAALAGRPASYRGGQVGGNRSRGARVADAPAGVDGSVPVAPPATGTTARAIAMKEGYLALLRQLEFDEKAGLVVPIDDVVREVASEYAALKNLIMGMASKLAPRVIACRTPSEAEAVIRTECELVLRTLSE
jgi:hypothetical protein